jgi:hypothetical protein
MPTQIPAKSCARSAESADASLSRIVSRERSWRTEAKEILMLSLLAAAIVYTVAFAIIWAYS